MAGEEVHVRMTGSHPWAGSRGVITAQASDHIEVTLNNGQRVWAYPGQWRRVALSGGSERDTDG